MVDLAELLIRGVFLGVIYGLIAIPMSLVYLTTDTVDLATGGYAVLAGTIASVVGGTLGIVAGVGAAGLGACCAAGTYILLRKRTDFEPITVVLATFGVAMCLESLVLWRWGVNPFVGRLFHNSLAIGPVSFTPQGILNLSVACLSLVLLYFVVYRTAIGRMMRASSVDAVAAGLAGVPVKIVQVSSFIVGGLMSGVAGVLVLYTTGLDYSAGLRLTLIALGGAVLFGLRSPLRAFLGGLLIGVAETVGTSLIPGGFGSVLPMVFVLLILGSGAFNANLVEETRP